MAQARERTTPLEIEMWGVRDRATRLVPEAVDGADAEAMEVCMTLRTASNVVFHDLSEHLASRTDINGAMLNVLLIAYLHDEVELRRLTRFTNMKKATASALVDSMVQQGLLARRTSPDDRRVLLLSLTPAGSERFREAFLEYNSRERRWAELLTPAERTTLVEILTNLVNRGIAAEEAELELP
jgi:DNA-binding MarR family transcriptional regulator